VSVFERTPVLLLAVTAGDPDVVRDLFDIAKPDRDLTLTNGMTGLHIAAGRNDSKMADLLLARGANPALEDRNGARPDQIAKEKGFSELSRKLEGQALARLKEFIGKMMQYGYVDKDEWIDPVVKRRALRMFQYGQKDLIAWIGTAGACIAVVKRPFGWHVVSAPRLDEAEAATDAMDNCRIDHASGCTELWRLCAS